ncbi:hypothetical protein EMCRGX_G034740 [Ephydatia muelleri]
MLRKQPKTWSNSDDGRSPLHIASGNGHLDIVNALIEAGANVNLADKDGMSPLHLASNEGHLDTVKVLIEAGANVNQANKVTTTKTKQVQLAGAGVSRAELETSSTKKQSDALQQNIRLQVQRVEERATRVEEEARRSNERAVRAEEEARRSNERAVRAEEEARRSNERAVRAEEEARRSNERAVRAEEEARRSNERAVRAEEEARRSNERAVRAEEEARRSNERAVSAEQRATIAEQKATIAEQRATTAELETKQQNQVLQQQTKIRAEQDLVLSKQQSKAQQKYPVTQGIPQNSDYFKSSWKIERDEIDMIEGKPLGVGGWGEVRVAMFRGVKVAAKLIHEAIISPHNIDLFLREMNIAASVRHPNLLLFIGATLDDNRPVILTELMPANLRNIIETPSQLFSRGHVISVSTDVARGLNYLHLMRPDPIIHRDVSSANVLLEPIGSGNWKAKVSDYGSANFLSKVTTMGPGNVTYAAPESLNPKRQSPKMDVYSYGILLLEMVTRKFPDYTLIGTLIDTLLWQEIATIIRRCICEDPVNRPTLKDILILMPQLSSLKTSTV